jgi:choline dehydrogenase-like flavoprotein
MTNGITDNQRATLRVLCDTFFPAVLRVDDPSGFWTRRASDLGIDVALAAFIGEQLPERSQAGVRQLLDALPAHGFLDAPASGRESLIAAVEGTSQQASGGIVALRRLTLMLAYALPDAGGRNPNWTIFGYPGPLSAKYQALPSRIRPVVPPGDELTLEADVCVVGSGAGGGVIAATLASGGMRVVVLEAGDYYTEEDFPQLELWASQHLFWRGGFAATAEGNVSLLAGANLGGGTTVNYMNGVSTPDRIRALWAREFGLEGLDGAEFDDHLSAVLERISANDRCSDYNGPHQRLIEGAQRLGYKVGRALRNADPARYDPDSAGYVGFGDRSGERQCTTRTFLQDAFDHGASIVTRCKADRVLVEHSRAAGVQARYTDTSGRRARVKVRAPQVVVACGALETPALLLRSGLGGRQVGQHLRLHPTIPLVGVFDAELRPWWGPPQAAICDQFADLEDPSPFVIEGTHFAPGLFAAAASDRPAAAHKAFMAEMNSAAVFIAILGDRGAGRVVLDDHGEPLISYPLDDPCDIAGLRSALAELARLHAAAGAREIHGLARGSRPWQRGEAVELFVLQLQSAALGAAGHPLFSAHQMGTARMGLDPAASVATPRGELHDTPGVWIGDTSAFPTALGTNPMVTCMALARRTAAAIAAARSGLVGQGRAVPQPRA